MSLRKLREVSRLPVGPPPLVTPDPDAPISTHDLESALLDLHAFGLQPGVSSGWASLDPFYTIKPGQVTIITGMPHSGKSPVVMQMVLHCVLTHQWKVAVSSPEHLPYDNLLAHLYQQYYRCPFEALTQAELMRSNDELHGRLFFLPPSETNATISHVLACCRSLTDQGLTGLLIDPYGEYEHKRPPGMNETEYISQLLTEIRHFARTYAVHVWLVAHPKKMNKLDDGSYPVVTAYDIAGSAAFSNKPDINLSVYREEGVSNRTQIHIQKVKLREIGHKGVVTLGHDPRTGTFFDLPADVIA